MQGTPKFSPTGLAVLAVSLSIAATYLPVGSASAAVSHPSARQDPPPVTTIVGLKNTGGTVTKGEGAGLEFANGSTFQINLLPR
jgi:hypothetical protein